MSDVAVIPDYTDAIIAIRAFGIESTPYVDHRPLYMRRGSWPQEVSPRAYGLAYREPWDVGPNKAKCQINNKHVAPNPSCGCGFYALADAQALENGYSHNSGYDHAIVKLWGRVVPGEGGWRAEYAEIVAFLLTKRDQKRRLRKLARAYRVPLLSDLPQLTPPIVERADPKPWTIGAMGTIGLQLSDVTWTTPTTWMGNVVSASTDDDEGDDDE